MKLILVLSVLAGLVQPSAALFNFLNDILNTFGLFDFLAQSACDAGVDALEISEVANCNCVANFDLISLITTFSLGGQAVCTLNEPACVVPDTFCGEATATIDVEAGGDGFEGNVTACFDADTDLPSEVTDLTGAPDNIEFCLTAVATGLALDGCTLSINGDDCQTCSICDNGFTVEGDCTNVNLAKGIVGDPFVPGPVIDTCVLVTITPPPEEMM